MVVFTIILKRLAAPETGDNVESFVQQFGTRLALGHFAHLCEAGIRRTQPHGEDGAPIRELVERHRLAGQFPGAHA